MRIETPTARLSLYLPDPRTGLPVRSCEVARRDDGSPSGGEVIVVYMELAPQGSVATLAVSPSEGEALAHALLRATDPGGASRG